MPAGERRTYLRARNQTINMKADPGINNPKAM